MRRVRVFLNAKSGAGECTAERLHALFAREQCVCEITELTPDVDLPALARAEPPEVAFVAAGGDGTVNAVANAVAGSERRMGVLPVGTLNHFAKDLSLPLELEPAVKVAAGTCARPVDAAEVNGCIFVNNSSLGFYPAMVTDREHLKKTGWTKWLALGAASARAFIRLKRLAVQVVCEGEQIPCRTPFLFIGNNTYRLDGGQLGTRERLDAGELWLCLAPTASRLQMLRLGVGALLGRAGQSPELTLLREREVTVEMRARRVRVSVDGEVRLFETPLRYRTRPGALHVLCLPQTGPRAGETAGA